MPATATHPVIVSRITPVELGEVPVVLRGLSWQTYIRLSDELTAAGRRLRMFYDRGTLEIMTNSARHERWGSFIGRLIETMASDLDLDVEALGSTTFLREALEKGFEPDECYLINRKTSPAALHELDFGQHHSPDLVVEVDVTSSSVPREPIYAAFGVRELWRYDGQRFQILELKDDQRYHSVEASVAFPFLLARDLQTFLARVQTEPQPKVIRVFRDWLRERASKS